MSRRMTSSSSTTRTRRCPRVSHARPVWACGIQCPDSDTARDARSMVAAISVGRRPRDTATIGCIPHLPWRVLLHFISVSSQRRSLSDANFVLTGTTVARHIPNLAAGTGPPCALMRDRLDRTGTIWDDPPGVLGHRRCNQRWSTDARSCSAAAAATGSAGPCRTRLLRGAAASGGCRRTVVQNIGAINVCYQL
jgi:hypothetical protein